MPRLLGCLRTRLQLAPRTLLAVMRPRNGRIVATESAPAISVSSSTAVVSAVSTPGPHDKPARFRFGLRPVPRLRTSREVAKDTLLLGLQALAESADAFPPLKSTVCGLLFFVKQVDVSASLASSPH